MPATIPAGAERRRGHGAQDDLSNPTNFVTKPLDEFGKLPVISVADGAGLPSLTTRFSHDGQERCCTARYEQQAARVHVVDRWRERR